jgi:signal transduction histidine kinase
VKLTSTARLRIVTLATAIFLTSGIGIFVAETSYRDAVGAIDSSIVATISEAKSTPGQELSAALFHLDQNSLDLSLYLLSRDGSATTVKEATRELIRELTVGEVSKAIGHVISGRPGSDYRFSAFEISGGDFLIVAGSSHDALGDLHSNLSAVALVTILTSLLTFFILSLYIRRLKKRDDADALKRMQRFLGDASHELRTPLTVIKGYVEMLSKGQMSEPSDQERAFSRVNSEIVRMESLIHDLLLLAELGESAKRESERIDLSSQMQAYAEDFKMLNPTRDVKIEIESGVYVDAVRDYLARFIQNGLNNITRHTDNQAPVRIALEVQGRVATVAIEDGGAGLPDGAYREEVQSLTRFDASRSRESGGSGLGMSIMAAVISRLGGKLRLRKSTLGGLAVIADLPLHREL